MGDLQWFTDLGASPIDGLLLVVGIVFAFVMIKTASKHQNKHQDDIRYLWKENKELRKENARLDSLSYGHAIAIKFISGSIDGMPTIDLIHQSADGDGNYSLNRDVG